SITPGNEDGKENNLEHSIATDNTEQAEALFVAAEDRMLDVNNWHLFAGPPTSTFRLTDSEGNELNRKAHKGDLIKRELPAAPGKNEGGGYDWVRIEALQYDDYPDTNREILAFTVRPVPAPQSSGENTAHFFDEDATSTFAVHREGKKVLATYHGRNEKPNTETSNLLDKARNAVVAV